MDLSASRAVAPQLMWLDQVNSTNTQLMQLAASSEGDKLDQFAVMATANQTDGKGRLGRRWQAPENTALAVSVLVRPVTPSGRAIDVKKLSWLGLLAGLAMSRAANSFLPADRQSTLKWPNDVLVDSRKLSGVLSELCSTSQGPAVVVGAGVNVLLTSEQLPVAHATSLLIEGSDSATIDDVLAAYLQEFTRIAQVFLAAEADVRTSGLLDLVSARCSTLGKSVRVELPSGETIIGTATELRPDGSLAIKRAADSGAGSHAESDAGSRAKSGQEPGEFLVVSAGDVTHLRVIPPGNNRA